MKKIALIIMTCICITALMQCDTTTSKTDTGVDSTAVDSASTKTSNSADVTANWKIGVQMWTFRMFSFADALNKVDSAGVKNIEAFIGQDLGGGMKGKYGLDMSR